MRLVSPNLHYRFYVEYFEDLDPLEDLEGKEKRSKEVEQDLEARNDGLWSFCPPAEDPFAALGEAVQSFVLYTAYPGLLMGLGNAHEIKLPGAVKLGFSLDYVTGLPWLPGSSLKGQLRSCFRKKDQSYLIGEYLGKAVDVGELEKEIFDGGDCFLGAFPVCDGNTPMLAPETITPHPDKLKNPKPISLMKIRPSVPFRFAFLLHDAKELGVSAAEKLALFRTLLEELGVGAKTNVGFGRMTTEQRKTENQLKFDNEKLPLIGDPAKAYTKTDAYTKSEAYTKHEPPSPAPQRSRAPESRKGGGKVLGPCPKCDANVVSVRPGFGKCSNRDCGFQIGTYFGTSLSDEQIRALLHGESVVLENHVDKRTQQRERVSIRIKGCQPDKKHDGIWWPFFDRQWR